MNITEDRVTIFTKNTGKYSGIALILDLTRSINHTYGSSVASHPIEGSGNTVADHQYLKNIKIQISGHVSNGVKVPQLTSDFDSFGAARNYNEAIEEDLDRIEDETTKDVATVSEVQADVPMTQEQADAMNRADTFGNPYSEGSTIDSLSFEEVIEDTSVNQQGVLETTGNQKQEFINDQALDAASATGKSDRRVYSTNQTSKQLDALLLLENIRDNRLLVDILTPNRLYKDMTINFNLPRNMRQGTALEVNCVFEQQRFVEAEVESIPYSSDSDLIDDKDNKDEKPKEVKDPANIKRAEDILNTTIVE